MLRGYIPDQCWLMETLLDSEAKTTINQPQEEDTGSKFFEDHTKIDLMRSDLKRGKKFVMDGYHEAAHEKRQTTKQTESSHGRRRSINTQI
jgi:hypothetical protein